MQAHRVAFAATLFLTISCSHEIKIKTASKNLSVAPGEVNATESNLTDIAWSSTQKLSWNDFKKAYKFDKASRPPFDAISLCSILTSTEKVNGPSNYKVFIRTIFHASGSWVDPKKKNPELLDHEQGHFDLAEIYARKLRKVFTEEKLDDNNVAFAVGIIVQKYSMQYKERQVMYDTETNHGRDKESQIKWTLVIKAELEKLSVYAF